MIKQGSHLTESSMCFSDDKNKEEKKQKAQRREKEQREWKRQAKY